MTTPANEEGSKSVDANSSALPAATVGGVIAAVIIVAACVVVVVVFFVCRKRKSKQNKVLPDPSNATGDTATQAHVTVNVGGPTSKVPTEQPSNATSEIPKMKIGPSGRSKNKTRQNGSDDQSYGRV